MICQKDEGLKDRVSIVMRLKKVLYFCRKGEKIKAIKEVLYEGKSHGYYVGLINAKVFVEAILSNRQPCTVWRLNGEEKAWNGKSGLKIAKIRIILIPYPKRAIHRRK